MSSNVILSPVLQLVAFFYFCKVRITQWRKKDFTDHGMPQASRNNPTIGGFSVQANRASCVLVGQKVFCPTRTNLPALAGDFSPKSKNPIKGSPDVNMENGTKKLSLAVFFPRKRKQSCHMLTDFSCITCLLTDKIELYRLFRILRKKTSSGCELPFALLTTLPLQNILQWYL